MADILSVCCSEFQNKRRLVSQPLSSPQLDVTLCCLGTGSHVPMHIVTLSQMLYECLGEYLTVYCAFLVHCLRKLCPVPSMTSSQPLIPCTCIWRVPSVSVHRQWTIIVMGTIHYWNFNVIKVQSVEASDTLDKDDSMLCCSSNSTGKSFLKGPGLSIIKTFEECSSYSEDPNVKWKIKDLSLRFEKRIFENATSKDDYVGKIFRKLKEARSYFTTILASPIIGNQLVNTNMSRQVHHPDIARLNSDGSCLPLEKQNILPAQLYSFHNPMVGISSTAMQQRDVVRQPDLSIFHQNRQFGQQNISWQRDLRHQPLCQQSMSVQEPNWTSISMLNMNRGQWSVEASHQHQVSNVHAQQMLHQASSTQLLPQLVYSQEQRNQFQDSWAQGSQIPATYLHSQNATGENTYIIPSQMGLAGTATAFSASPDAETTDVAAWQSLITQFRLMRLRYLSDVLKLQKKAKDQYAHAQSLEQLQRNRHVMAVTARMIEFLHLTEHKLILIPKDKLMDFMNQIIRFVEKNSAGIQAVQMSSSYGDQNLSLGISQAPQRMLQLGNPQKLLEKKDNLLLPPVINATSGIFKPDFSRHQLSETSSLSLLSSAPHNGQPLLSTEVPQSFSLLDQTKDTPYLSDPGASLEPETSIFGFDSPMNPSTQSSVPMKISKPDESFLLASSPKKNVESQTRSSKENVESQTGTSKENVESQTGASKENVETTKVLDQSTSLAKPGISAVTSQPDSTGSESKQLSESATQPNDRLAEAVQSTSDPNLTSSVDDMFSSIDAIDRLLEFAFEDEFQWNMHMDMESFLGRRSTQEMDDDNEGDIPVKRLKCDIGSSSRDASMTMDKDDTSKSSK